MAEPPDAGVDAGTDAGTPPVPLALPSLPGWSFYGPQHGGPSKVFGVSADRAGNLWVAGGDEGLFLLTPGETRYRRFTVADGLTPYLDASGPRQQPVLSVAGGPAGTVMVGYQGMEGGLEDNDPPEMVKSGDADQVVFNGAGLTVTHFDLSTGPGVDPHYPTGRDKIRHVFRIVYDAKTGDVWFGGNHGVAMWNNTARQIQEHQHADINGFTAAGHYTLLSGDYFGLGLDPSGDLWFGGGHRLGKLAFASEGRKFWATLTKVDVWPDAQQVDPRPDERTDDYVQDLAIFPDGTVWVGSIPNGLARIGPGGTDHLRSGLVDPKVTALEADPADGSLWVGHLWGGITRLGSGTERYDQSVFGKPLIDGAVLDLQSDWVNGQRRILVAFGAGAIGVYSGR